MRQDGLFIVTLLSGYDYCNITVYDVAAVAVFCYLLLFQHISKNAVEDNHYRGSGLMAL